MFTSIFVGYQYWVLVLVTGTINISNIVRGVKNHLTIPRQQTQTSKVHFWMSDL